MRIGFALPQKKARIEIIPLIDIMFFLLASFMLASLAMIHLESMDMALPTATVPGKTKPDEIDLRVRPDGDLYVGTTNYSVVDLRKFLARRYHEDARVQVYIEADPAAKYGMFINALDLVREVGIPNVSCAVTAPSKSGSAG